VSESKAVGDTD